MQKIVHGENVGTSFQRIRHENVSVDAVERVRATVQSHGGAEEHVRLIFDGLSDTHESHSAPRGEATARFQHGLQRCVVHVLVNGHER